MRSLKLVLMTLYIVALLSACQSGGESLPEMSLEEAQELVLTFENADYVRPERSVSNILERNTFRARLETEMRINTGLRDVCGPALDEKILTRNKEILISIANMPLGNETRGGRDNMFLSQHKYVFRQGYFEESMLVLKQALYSVPREFARAHSSYRAITAFRMGWLGEHDIALASAAMARERVQVGRRYSITWPLAPHIDKSSFTIASAETAQNEGKLKLAEGFYRQALTLHYTREYGIKRALLRGRLAMNLQQQNRLVEAETEVREAINNVRTTTVENATLVIVLADILFDQARYEDAENIAYSALKLLDSRCAPHRSIIYALARNSYAKSLAAQERWVEAREQYDAIEAEHGKAYPESFERHFSGNLDWGLALVYSDRIKAGLERIELAHDRLSTYLGDDNFDTALALGYVGIARLTDGDISGARDAFEDSVPILIEQRNDVGDIKEGTTRARRLRDVLEAYLSLLSRDYKHNTEPLDAKLVEDMFLYADIARSGAVQNALAAANARAVKEPRLAELVRQEQDSRLQIKALTALVLDLRIQNNEEMEALLKKTEKRLEETKLAQRALLGEIESRFPAYANRLNPRAGTVSDVRQSLKSEEAMVAVYVARDQSYVWAVPKQGAVAFSVVPRGDRSMTALVDTIRTALSPDVQTLGDIPAFDIKIAHGLYRELLAPVKSVWGEATNLVVVTHRALGRLPFEVLPTEPVTLKPSQIYFGEYRDVPWLARSHSIAVVPSITTFREQREFKVTSKTERPFIGFGDPRFEASADESRPMNLAQNTDNAVQTRSLVLRAPVKTRGMSSATLESLPRLPETAEEVGSIARVLGADPDRDVFLGLAANEENIYQQPLEKYRVVAFATHGLVPGDLNGLSQPALAFSNPAIAEVEGDGLLQLDEVLSLKLDADWVVLSACNTGAADGAGSEAISGLGRAFFYAGARSLLVTHWPVETTSAKALTTAVFSRQAEFPAESRAQALQAAQLSLIDGAGYRDKLGNTIYYYAHPLFWGSFALVGDGG